MIVPPLVAPRALLTLIMQQYFSTFYCVLQFSDDTTVNNAGKNGNYLLKGDTKLGAKDVKKYDLCLGIVINPAQNSMETFEMFENFIHMQSKARFDRRRYVVTFDETMENFEQFFQSPYLKFVSDVLVVKKAEGRIGEFEMYTHQFVGLNGTRRKVFLDEWNLETQTFKLNVSLFPNKMQNLQGKKLIVGGEKYLPITDPENLKGPETVLLVEFGKLYNATLIFDRSFDYLGVYRANWTGTGYIGTLLQDKIDLIAYSVYIQADRSFFGDFSRPLCEIRVTCLVPKPKTLNKWMIIKIFTYDVWLLIGAQMIIMVVIFKLLRVFFKRHDPANYLKHKLEYLISYRFLIGQSSNLSSQWHMERLLFSILLTCFILIQTFFNSKLSSYIAVPTYIDDINTLDQLASDDILWYSKFNDKGKIISMETAEPLATLYKKFRFVEGEISTIKDQRYAYAVDESFASHFYTIDEYFTMQMLVHFKVMKEYIIGHQYTAYLLRRNSVWLRGIDNLCQKAIEHGLVKYWEKDSISDPVERKIQEYLGLSRSTEPPKVITLDLRFFMSIFIIWASGLVAATFVFIFERFKSNSNLKIKS